MITFKTMPGMSREFPAKNFSIEQVKEWLHVAAVKCYTTKTGSGRIISFDAGDTVFVLPFNPALDQELLSACLLGSVEKVRGLLDKNADVNARDEDNKTPLHWAIQKGHEAVARLL